MKNKMIKWMAIVACVAVAVVTTMGCLSPNKPGSSQGGTTMGDVSVVQAAYPEPVAEDKTVQEFVESDDHWNWWETYRETVDKSTVFQEDMGEYYSKLMEKILVAEDDNTVCSPLNTYIAFAMLAEVSGGNTRQQILDVLNVPDIETLRSRVNALWLSNYVDTPTLKSTLANSVWLREGTGYKEDTLNELAKTYFASTFRGDPASEDMSKALQQWTDENTGGLLSEYTKDMKLDADTVLALVSTIYFKAAWAEEFWEEGTKTETFHGTKGDTQVDMMHKSEMMGTYQTDAFTAVGLGLVDSGTMYFYLPNEGVDVNTLASDPDVLKVLKEDWADGNWSSPEVHMSVPKFKVSGKTDLLGAVAELGITDALNPSLSDFTPLTEDVDELFLSTADHAAMVEIDEKGVTGAAYTELMLAEGAALPENEIDFVLDRPFMFVVKGADGSVLFSGIVRNITE